MTAEKQIWLSEGPRAQSASGLCPTAYLGLRLLPICEVEEEGSLKYTCEVAEFKADLVCT